MKLHRPDADAFFNSIHESPPVSIRLHPYRTAGLPASGRVCWCSNGFYLDNRPAFILDPLFHGGAYFVQEASSMFLEQYILQTRLNEKPVTVLDLCASPGGKSTHLLSLLHKDSILVANEAIRSRIPALKENIIKWGYPNVLLTNNDPSAFSELQGIFDLIICDAPCSGEGMFRKDPDSIKHWSEAKVKHCAERQKRIVGQAWKALKPGGIFIYSTCTYNADENEEVLWYLLQNFDAGESIRLNIQGMEGVEMTENPINIYRFFPHLIKGEGFTIAGLRKSEKESIPGFRHSKNIGLSFKPSNRNVHWLNMENGKLYENDGMIIHLNHQVKCFAENYGYRLNLIYAGTPVAEIKGNEIIPSQASCMSILFRRNSFPEIESEHKDALRFLKGETSFAAEAPEGILLFTYKNLPLGFARKTGNRFNNHYPKGWRIRMELNKGLQDWRNKT